MAKFSVGEICEALYHDGSWKGCEVLALPGASVYGGVEVSNPALYVIEVPEIKSPKNARGLWLSEERFLRKRKPPGDENQKKFFTDLDKFIKDLPTVRERGKAYVGDADE